MIDKDHGSNCGDGAAAAEGPKRPTGLILEMKELTPAHGSKCGINAEKTAIETAG